MHSAPPPVREKLWHVGSLTYTTGGLMVLFGWLLMGDFAWAMRDRSVGPMAQWYLTSLGVSGLLFGLLFSSFPALIGLVLGPVISVMSDRHRGPWGRRIPFLLLTTPVAAAGMIGLGLTPFISKQVHALMPSQSEMLVSLICFGVFWTAFEFATIASQSVFGGLINDVVPTELLGRFHALFRMVSLVDGMIFNWYILGLVPLHYAIIFITVGTFYGVAFFLVCLNVKEGEYPPPPPVEAVNIPVGQRIGNEVSKYWNECFQSRYYVLVFFMLLVNGMTISPFNTFSMPYRESVGMSMEEFGRIQTGTFFISMVLSYRLGWMADVHHPLRITIATVALYGLSCVWGAFYANTTESFAIALFVHNVLSGCFYTCSASLGARLFPRSRFAQFGSAVGILGSLVGLVFAPLVGSIIDASGKEYRYTFAIGAVLSAIAMVLSVLVYRKFLALGGSRHYVAPEA